MWWVSESKEELRKRTEFRRIGVKKWRRNKSGKFGYHVRCSLELTFFLCVAEWSRTVLPQNLFCDQIFKCISASWTSFQTVISWSFFMFNYLKTLLNIIRSFLSQITILESIIQFKDQLRVKSRAVKVKVKRSQESS